MLDRDPAVFEVDVLACACGGPPTHHGHRGIQRHSTDLAPLGAAGGRAHAPPFARAAARRLGGVSSHIDDLLMTGPLMIFSLLFTHFNVSPSPFVVFAMCAGSLLNPAGFLALASGQICARTRR